MTPRALDALMRAFALALLAALAWLAPVANAEPCIGAPGLATACLVQSSTQAGPYTITEAGASLDTPLAEGAAARVWVGCATDGQGSGCDFATQGAALRVDAIRLDARAEHVDTPHGEWVCIGPQPGEATCASVPLP